ncbi:MAG TPA: retropepsin-like aspartic protease [Sphingomicrobium sp.]
MALLPAAAIAKSVTVPLRFYGTRPAVEVMVKGQGPFFFLVDTGAGGPPGRADASLVKRLGLAKEGESQSSDSGSASVAIDRVTLPSVNLGGYERANVPALTRDYGSPPYLPKLDGILGPAFFKGRLLTIDYVRSTLTIADGELPPADGRTILDYELVDGDGIWIPVSIGGKSARAEIDTGNIRALDMPAEAVQPLRMATFPRLAGNSTSVSGTTQIREVTLAAPLQMGSHRIERPAATFSEDFHEWNIGSAMLQDFVITLDQKNRRVRLVRSRPR